MQSKNFTITVASVFLSVTIAQSIANISTNFSWVSLVNFINIVFLALNFFYAKFFLLHQEEYNQEGFFTFSINIITLATFAFMPFFMDKDFAFFSCHIALRVSDILLIISNNRGRKIPPIEKRWLRFDIIYINVLAGFVVLSYLFDKYSLILSISYFVLVIFESLFDFWINRHDYGFEQKESTPRKNGSHSKRKRKRRKAK